MATSSNAPNPDAVQLAVPAAGLRRVACGLVSGGVVRPPHIVLHGGERAGLLLRPFRAYPKRVLAPRVALRSTLGYDPAPLRGSKAPDSKGLSEQHWG